MPRGAIETVSLRIARPSEVPRYGERRSASIDSTRTSAGATIPPLWHDDEFALHEADDVLRCVEVGAGERIQDLLQLAVVEDELERVELARGQVAELAGERSRDGERRRQRRQLLLEI